MIRNDRFTFTDRSRMKMIGMKKREGRILAAPDWDLRNLGPLYLREAESFIDRQSTKADEPFSLYSCRMQITFNGTQMETMPFPVKFPERRSKARAVTPITWWRATERTWFWRMTLS